MGVYIPTFKPTSCKDCIINEAGACRFDKNTCPLIEIDLVRCGECKWQKVNKKNGLHGCGHGFGLIKADDDNYCPYGERRAE